MATTGPHNFHGRRRTAKEITSWSAVVAVLFGGLREFPHIEPALERLGVPLLFGWLLAFGASSYLFSVFNRRKREQHLWQVLIGVAYLMGGFDLLIWFIGIFVGMSIVMSGMKRLTAALEVWGNRGHFPLSLYPPPHAPK